MTPTTLEVFADIACPFTHVGLRRVVERRDGSGRSDLRLRVRAWPLEFVNDSPLDPEFIAEEVVEIRRQIAPDLFEGFRPEHFPATTLPAFAVVAAAYRRGDAKGEELSLTLRDLLFERGVDISDPDVLAQVAAEHDLRPTPADHASVAVDHREGTARGVVGSPHFFTATESFFCPALRISRDDAGALHVAGDETGFERLMDACLSS